MRENTKEIQKKDQNERWINCPDICTSQVFDRAVRLQHFKEFRFYGLRRLCIKLRTIPSWKKLPYQIDTLSLPTAQFTIVTGMYLQSSTPLNKTPWDRLAISSSILSLCRVAWLRCLEHMKVRKYLQKHECELYALVKRCEVQPDKTLLFWGLLRSGGNIENDLGLIFGVLSDSSEMDEISGSHTRRNSCLEVQHLSSFFFWNELDILQNFVPFHSELIDEQAIGDDFLFERKGTDHFDLVDASIVLRWLRVWIRTICRQTVHLSLLLAFSHALSSFNCLTKASMVCSLSSAVAFFASIRIWKWTNLQKIREEGTQLPKIDPQKVGCFCRSILCLYIRRTMFEQNRWFSGLIALSKWIRVRKNDQEIGFG